ncbi:MAG: SEL1-like repeat protein, partial [Clostridia bacterium]|nr:SEL1-like repeat protein [Clostridia bacterium]
LGYAYQCGQGVEIDLEEAARWYEMAALAGHRNALLVYRVLRP